MASTDLVVAKIVPSLLTPEQVREELIAHFHGYNGITHGWEHAVADLVVSKLQIVTVNPQPDGLGQR